MVQSRKDRGERICADCGLVLYKAEIEYGPEWRSFSNEEADGRSRVGAPVTELLHDKGLSTTIGWQL
ncbi:TFIIB-type zinc ribbon-containing protein [Natrialba sp. PRR66]|uniref:TFIIB-type zinc ribbon-containing protein n=1 Tax=Natrialba sp. PRR66 TaxID=3098146 RepID=UPI002B1D57AC|nr:TFIIB-type zinc ribbon-containing protein [Natrialba sp. PRR66]